MHTHTHSRTHTYMHAQLMHTCVRTHTCTHTHTDLLDNTVVSLFNGVCDFGRELGVRHYDNIFDFEGGVGSSETWRGWNGKTPEIVEDESFCGRHSLYVSCV